MTDMQRVEIPETLMKVITTIASDVNLNPRERLEGVLILTYGLAVLRRVTDDKVHFAIPTAQWHQICGDLTIGVPDDRITQVNLGLDWMNSGPSAYDEPLLQAQTAQREAAGT
jgi:hypothetical protein